MSLPIKSLSDVFDRYVHFYRSISHGSGKVLLWSVLVGGLAACGAILFQLAVSWSKSFFLESTAGVSFDDAGWMILGEDSHRWVLLFLPAIGGLLGGLLVWRFAPEAKGHGTDGVIEAYHFKRGHIRLSVPIVKTIASAITIGTGGSAGKEGPIAQIAAGMASVFGQQLKLPPRQMRILIIAGLAAGIGAVFQAPLAAGLFAAEVLYREMEFDRDVIMPALIAPIIAFAVYSIFFPGHHLFHTGEELTFHGSFELIPYTVVAIVTAIGARGFIRLFDRSERWFSQLTLPDYLKPAVGGLMVGVIGFLLPNSLSESYGYLARASLGELSFWALLLGVLAKMATTSLTIGSGGSGGVFGPSMVIGGLLGGLIGQLFSPWLSLQSAAFVVVGMAGFFSAAANTPLSTIFMVSELTGSYGLLVPTMWVATLSYILGRGDTLYKSQLWNHFEAPAELGEVMAKVLDKMDVGSACPKRPVMHLIPESTSLSELDERDLFEQDAYGVVDQQGHFVGLLDRQSIRFARREGQGKLLVVDLMHATPVLSRDDSLYTALKEMMNAKVDLLFVLEKGEAISYLSKKDILAAYDRRMKGLQLDPQEDTPVLDPVEEGPLRFLSAAYDLDLSSREEVLDYFADLLGKGDLQRKETIKETLLERENLASTAVGRGVAFPHPHHRELAETDQGMYVLTTNHPIDYQAMDHQGVRIFVLFWTADAKRHIEGLSRVAKLVAKGLLASWIQRQPSSAELNAAMAQWQEEEASHGSLS